MIQQDKDLLLKDLCARLPYGVKVQVNDEICTLIELDYESLTCGVKHYDGHYSGNNIEEIKPYLRPILSMTKEEFDVYEIANEMDTAESAKAIRKNLHGEKYISSWYHGVDWLNANHFDYRGLIAKGLALEAPEGMYN